MGRGVPAPSNPAYPEGPTARRLDARQRLTAGSRPKASAALALLHAFRMAVTKSAFLRALTPLYNGELGLPAAHPAPLRSQFTGNEPQMMFTLCSCNLILDVYHTVIESIAGDDMRFERVLTIPRRHQELIRLVRTGDYSASRLAQALHVSEPTVNRDILFLRQNGYPIVSIRMQSGWAYRLDQQGIKTSRAKRRRA